MSIRANVARKYRKEYLRQTGNYSICTQDNYFRNLNDVRYWKDLINENWESIFNKLTNKGMTNIRIYKGKLEDDTNSKIEYLIVGTLPINYRDGILYKYIIGKATNVQEAYNIVCDKITNCKGSQIFVPEMQFLESMMKKD